MAVEEFLRRRERDLCERRGGEKSFENRPSSVDRPARVEDEHCEEESTRVSVREKGETKRTKVLTGRVEPREVVVTDIEEVRKQLELLFDATQNRDQTPLRVTK